MGSTRSARVVVFILVVWFAISFVTNIIGPLMPIIIDNYGLSLTLGAFLPFSFFLAYGIASIPAGIMVEKIGMKVSMMVAFGLNLLGVSSFALFPVYGMAIVSLFIVGIGMAMLQVIINPLMRTAGGEEHFAFFSVTGQLVFGLASFVSPMVFTYLMVSLPDTAQSNPLLNALRSLVPEGMSWVSLYWLFSATFLVLLFAVSIIRLPAVELQGDERSGSLSVYRDILKNRQALMFFFGIICYVGTEQGVANWMSQFLNTYHGVDPETTGAALVGRFWGLMSLGCVMGLALLKVMDSRHLLRLFTVISALILAAALFGSKEISVAAFPWIGFFISVMFSMIFSLGLNSVSLHHGAYSGVLCTGIFGGALVPMMVGVLGDLFGLRGAMCLMFLTLAFIFGVGVRADPLISNSRISLAELKGKLTGNG